MHNVRTNSELQVQDVPVGLFFEEQSHLYGGGGGVCTQASNAVVC